MLKKGDLIIANEGRSNEPWWVMDRDENPNDHINAHCVGPPPPGFEESPTTAWDSETVTDQGARAIPEAEVPDKMWAAIAKYQLTGE
jgi:hypothetical protein